MKAATTILSICCFIGFLSPLYYKLAEKTPLWAIIIPFVLGSSLAIYINLLEA